MNALDLVWALRKIGSPIDVHKCYWHVVRDAESRGYVSVAPVRIALHGIDYVRVTIVARMFN